MATPKKHQSKKGWLDEHNKDPYVLRARKEGFRSRAVYKLLEIHEKDRLIKPGMTVVDLGAAPGGWSQVAAGLVGHKGRVIATDILEMGSLAGVEFVHGDFREDDVLNQLMNLLKDGRADLVISDMAPNISGMNTVDQPRAMYLAELALDMARNVLDFEDKHCAMLVKVFQGAGFDEYMKEMRLTFKKVVVRKPKASRPRSREVYVLGTNNR